MVTDNECMDDLFALWPYIFFGIFFLNVRPDGKQQLFCHTLKPSLTLKDTWPGIFLITDEEKDEGVWGEPLSKSAVIFILSMSSRH